MGPLEGGRRHLAGLLGTDGQQAGEFTRVVHQLVIARPDRVEHGEDGRFCAYRLKAKYRDSIPRFIGAAFKYEGRPYDIRYQMETSAIYCSELIYRAFHDASGEELGATVRLGDLNWQPHQKSIERFEGGPVPLDRLIITPVAISKARQLERVYSAGL